ncbi:MAG: hypothetical protein U0R49_06980 [Fimbriimonadales bacterium]
MMIATMLFAIALDGYEPTASYKKVNVEGFTVRISAKLSADAKTLTPALDLLKSELKEVVELVPLRQVNVLRKIPIWMELNNPDFPCACYHPDVGWLKEHNYNPEKENGVEISNARTFVEWVNLNQPLMVLHELAHGYHDLEFGYDDAYIEACYKNAMANHLYDLVAHNRGGTRKGYASTNPMEYFAELSEAWFNGNDYFPFNRSELESHDPAGYALMKRVWSK